MPATTVAFTFPGQGSQTPGMGAPWVDHPAWSVVEEAEEWSGRDLRHLLLDADAEELRQTRNSQLVTFVGSMLVLEAVRQAGIEASFCAGHSLGEYSALVAAGAVERGPGARLVSERGEAMQAAANTADGTMAAVLGLDDDQVELACTVTDGDVWVANYNAPGQVVIAGAPGAIEAAGAKAKELGAKRAMGLKVGGAFHTPFMSPARDRLRTAIADTTFADPVVPVVANVDAALHELAAEWPGLLGAQLTSPVRWRQTLHTLSDHGVTVLLELGPGTVLTGLAKRTLKGTTALGISSPEQIEAVLEVVGQNADGAAGAVHEGEHLHADERLVVSPGTGVFEPVTHLLNGAWVSTGELLGRVGSHEVRSAFTGQVAGFLAHAGERVTTSQPVAWLRAHAPFGHGDAAGSDDTGDASVAADTDPPTSSDGDGTVGGDDREGDE